MSDFLLEIGTEEIPARMIDSAREELAKRVGDLLQRERLAKHRRLRPIPHRDAWRSSPPASLRHNPTSASRSPGRR